MKVIIVDDSMLIRMQLKKFFEEEISAEVVAMGEDGEEAVDLYKQYQPDLITLDLTMPNKSGFKALLEIIDFDARARVLICSAIKDQLKITESLMMGAKGFIKKPLRLADKDYIEEVKSDINEAFED